MTSGGQDMSQYIVSARKYRPDSFESLIGQDNIARTLKNSIMRNQLAHAYLFCGPRGVGKTSAARIFAKIINCEHPSENMEPCGHCESCISFQEGRSYCIHELDAASNNGVDDIKALMDQVQIPPQVGKYSVYIIDEVHMLTQAAFNAFLKTLEEPPAHAIFILATTEKHKILPTILSRCQTYDFNRISIPDIVRNLRDIAAKENITIDDESLHIIAQKADGAMRDALTIFDQTVAFCGTDVHYEDVQRNLNVLDHEHCFQLVDFFLSGNYQGALLKFDEVLSKGFNALHFVGALSSHFRDLMVAKSGSLDALLNLPGSLKEKYAAQAAACPIQFLFDALSITTACEAGYRASINPRLHIEFMLMKLSFLCGTGEVSLRPAAVAAPAPKTAATPLPQQRPTVQAPPVQAPEKKNPPQENPEEKPAPAVSAPAAAVTPEPKAETPARERRRPARSGSSLSISAIGEESSSGPKQASPIITGNEIPSDEAIQDAWKSLAEDYASKPRLAAALSSHKVEISEKDGVKFVSFFAMNTAQQQWLQESMRSQLEEKLMRKLQSSKVKLIIDLAVDEPKEAVPYTAKEKAEALMTTNPEVKELIKDFGLDV